MQTRGDDERPFSRTVPNRKHSQNWLLVKGAANSEQELKNITQLSQRIFFSQNCGADTKGQVSTRDKPLKICNRADFS
jgi:hypothetical protein